MKQIKKILIIMIPILCVALSVSAYHWNFGRQSIKLSMGVYSGSIWDNPGIHNFEFIDDNIRLFQIKNKDITIKYKPGIRNKDYSEWLSQSFLKGEQPDVFFILPSDFNTFASIGTLQNLDRDIAGDKRFDKSKFYSSALESGKFNDSLYALPVEIDSTLMFVNKSLLLKEHVRIPTNDWTWDDFLRICRQVTKDTDGDHVVDQFGAIDFTWQVAAATNGQRMFDDHGTEAYFNSSGFLESVSLVAELNQISNKIKPKETDFENGKVAFKPFPFSWYRTFKYSPYRIMKYSNFDWICIKLPKGPHGKNAGFLNSLLVGINSKTKNEKAAWEFVKFLTTDPQVQNNVFNKSEGISVLKAVTESHEAELFPFVQGDRESKAGSRLLSEVTQQSAVPTRFLKYQEIMDYVDKELYRAINEDEDLQKILEEINKEANKRLNFDF